MAIPNVNFQVVNQGGGAQGQLYSQGGVSGFQSRSLYLLGTAVLDGASTTFTANFIDGTQKLFQRIVNISAGSVTAPATIGGVANQSIISGVGAFGVLSVGATVVTSGFSNSGNNGTFTVNAVTTSSIQVTNSSAVAETNTPSGNVQVNLGGHVLSVRGSRATQSFAGVADSGLASIGVSLVASITDASAVVTISAAGTSTNTLSVLLEAIASL
jgi:hypothetical protein